MSISENRAARRQVAIEMNDNPTHFRLVRLSDRAWDLDAQYAMLMRQAGLTMP